MMRKAFVTLHPIIYLLVYLLVQNVSLKLNGKRIVILQVQIRIIHHV